jgi:hypothetical protein
MLQGLDFYGELMVNPYGYATGLPVVLEGCQMPVPLQGAVRESAYYAMISFD